MRVMMSDYLQLVKGNYRVKIEVPTHLPVYLPTPHTGKKFLVHGLGVSVRTQARKLSEPWIREFKGAIDLARAAYAAAQKMAAEAAGENWVRLSHYGDALDRALSEQYFQQIEINRGKPAAPPPPAPTAEDYAKAVVAAMRKDEEAKRQRTGITFDATFEPWSRGKSDAEVRGTRTVINEFSALLGSDDMGAAGRKEFIIYKNRLIDQMHNGEITSGTVSNKCGRLRAIYKYAYNNDKDQVLTDYISGVKLDITVESETPEDFTEDEMRRVLLASRTQTDMMVKWFQWLGVFLG